MKIFLEESELLDEFNNFLKSNFTIINNIKEANIVIFKNFELSHRKYILKNKHLKQKIYCFFYEPVTCKNYSKIIHRLNYFKTLPIISYSKSNIDLLKKYLGNQRDYYLLTNNYFSLINTKINKTINCLINHRDMTNFGLDCYRGYNSKVINPEIVKENNILLLDSWGDERDRIFSKTKIFINLHKSGDSKILETFRITELIKNRVIIISQNVVKEKTELFNDYIIYVPDNLLIQKYKEILENYESYYNKIYGNKTNEELFGEINKYFLKFKNNI
jgi:hypothetical protein